MDLNFIKDFVSYNNNSQIINKVPLTIREMGYLFLLFPLGLGLFLSVIGPFGTFSDLGLFDRLCYWLSISLLTWLQIIKALSVMKKTMPNTSLSLLYLLAIFSTSLLGALEVKLLESWFRPEHSIKPIMEIYSYVVLLATTVYTPFFILFLIKRTKENTPNHLVAQNHNKQFSPLSGSEIIQNKLSPHIRGELYCLKSEDHYLRVYTDKGNELIFFKMKDAVEGLKSYSGIRVHRSYWVNTTAIIKYQKESNKLMVQLKNNMKIPVSRSYYEDFMKSVQYF